MVVNRLWTFSVLHFVRTDLLTRCWLIVGFLGAGGGDCFSTFSSGKKLGSSSHLYFCKDVTTFSCLSPAAGFLSGCAVLMSVLQSNCFSILFPSWLSKQERFSVSSLYLVCFCEGGRKLEEGEHQGPLMGPASPLAIMYKHYTYCMNLQRNRRLLFELQRRCDSKRLLGLRGNARFTLYQFTSKRDQFYKHGRVCPHVLE